VIRNTVGSWLLSKFFNDGKLELSSATISELKNEIFFKESAIAKIESLISGSFCACDLNFYDKGDLKNDTEMYFLWNIRPNQNENISEFKNKIISHLIKDNECLVIYFNNQLFVADEFCREEYALLKNEYKSVVVKDFAFKKTFYEDEVYYFSLNDENIKLYIDGIYESYGELLAASKELYLDQADKHYFLHISANARGNQKFQENYADMTTNKLKKFMKHGNSVMPVYEGFEYKKEESKTSASTVDYREMKRETFSLCAQAYNIPTSMMFMDTADINDNVINNYITFGVKPILKTIQSEISSKNYGTSRENKCEFDITKIKYYNPLENADKIEKILGTGIYCVDAIRIKLGEKPLNTEWSKRHFMTKNIGTIEEILKSAEGLEVSSVHDENNDF